MSEDDTILLSPFEVTTEKDKGYKATNATSGTRLNTSIKDAPVAIEVITSDFIRDIGSANLRDALRYSAGVQIQNQNDYGNYTSGYTNSGGVNNPSGRTADKSDSNFVMRGFLTENVLRDGFRRRVTTDSIDISRVEVIRGPAALLYGTGNFGGVVNYIPKSPDERAHENVELTVGSNDFYRFTADTTGPLIRGASGKSKLAYRLNLAVQDNGDATQFYDNRKVFVAPTIVYRPFATTEIVLDTEFGRQRTRGIGFQSLRARADISAGDLTSPTTTTGQERFERAAFITFPNLNPRTMRWSGPDTRQDTNSQNIELKLTQKITDDLHLIAAYNSSFVSYSTLDIQGNATNSVGPASLWSTFYPEPLDRTRGDPTDNSGWFLSPVSNAIVQYQWTDIHETTRADQARVELNYGHTFFESKKWLRTKQGLLLGYSLHDETSSRIYKGLNSNGNVWNYRSIQDSTPFRRGIQGDGTPDQPTRLLFSNLNKPEDRATYAIYNGKFANDMLTVLGGIRQDKNKTNTRSLAYSYADGSTTTDTVFSSPTQTTKTKQVGVSIAPTKWFSVYGMVSEGFEPNFAGDRDLTGKALTGITAKNKEWGVKFDLLNGKVSGTISHYSIDRENVPRSGVDWAPQTAYLGRTGGFDPARPVVYNIGRSNPDAALVDTLSGGQRLIGYNNNYAWFGDLTKYTSNPVGSNSGDSFQAAQNDGLNLLREQIQSTWKDAKAAGAVLYYDNSGNTRITEQQFADLWKTTNNADSNIAYAMVNCSMAQGAAYMDAVYNYARQYGLAHQGKDNFTGWFFGSAPAGTGYNSAEQDRNGNATPQGGRALVAVGSDRNEGWDGQVIFTPTNEWQVLFSFTRNLHTVKSLGEIPQYPYQNLDRWTQWMFPSSGFALRGVYGKNEQYADETNTSTYQWKGLIYTGVQGSDYPKTSWSIFTNYKFDKVPVLKGLTLGAGVRYQGKREYASGYTHGGARIVDEKAEPVVLYTNSQKTFDVFARYEFTMRNKPAYVQVNADNVLDDKRRYGYIYAPGRSVSFRLGAEF